MKPLREGDPRSAGPYRLEGRLGTGGMGEVFLGRSRGGRPIAVKLVHADLAQDEEFRRRLRLEVEAAQRVGGFYTAQVVGADPDADPPWMATAYIAGPSLREALREHGPLPVPVVGAIGAGLAEGLAAIHTVQLVHRDLTPANVILAEDGPRIIDFGIVRALDAAGAILSTRPIGTPGFMSPEQVTGARIGPASDVFSLGAVLAFAATGRGPFGAGQLEAVIYRVVHGEPDLTGVPWQLAGLVAACLTKNPADRPAIAEILDQLATPAFPTGHWLPPDVTALIDRHRATVPDPDPRPAPLTPPPPAVHPPARDAPRQQPRFSAAVRKLADEHQVNLNAVQGTGPDGLVREQDVVAVVRAKHGVYATVAARDFARKHNIDLTKVAGSGKHGLILVQDAHGAVQRTSSQPSNNGGSSGGCALLLALPMMLLIGMVLSRIVQ